MPRPQKVSLRRRLGPQLPLQRLETSVTRLHSAVSSVHFGVITRHVFFIVPKETSSLLQIGTLRSSLANWGTPKCSFLNRRRSHLGPSHRKDQMTTTTCTNTATGCVCCRHCFVGLFVVDCALRTEPALCLHHVLDQSARNNGHNQLSTEDCALFFMSTQLAHTHPSRRQEKTQVPPQSTKSNDNVLRALPTSGVFLARRG